MFNGSQTLLFVLMEYIYKVLPRIKDHHQTVFQVLASTVELWYTNNATFLRPDKKPLEIYIENSVGRTIGQCLKFLYSNSDLRDWARDAIMSYKNPNFRLFLWRNFI